MKFLSSWCLLLLGVLPCAAQSDPVPGDEAAQVAARLRETSPESESRFSGKLKIRQGKQRIEVPVKGGILLQSNSWQAFYQSSPVKGGPAERLTIIHRPGQPNEYHYARSTGTNGTFGETQILSGVAAAIPFAGSDFWLSDLGLEYAHWPTHKIIDREMRKSRACKVLESRPAPSPKSPYSRVVSWVDNETGGLVIAEADDPAGKRLKRFEIKSFSKTDGRWQLEEMAMENLQTHSRTLLEFDL